MPESTFIGVVTGGAIALTTTIVSLHYTEALRRTAASNSVASIMLGGINSLAAIARRRGYADGLQGYIDHIERTGEAPLFQVQAKRQYSLIFEKNLENIGLLDAPLPEKICTFYTYINSIVEDFDRLFEAVDGDFKPEQLLRIYTEMLGLVRESEALAAEINALVSRTYPKATPLAWIGERIRKV